MTLQVTVSPDGMEAAVAPAPRGVAPNGLRNELRRLGVVHGLVPDLERQVEAALGAGGPFPLVVARGEPPVAAEPGQLVRCLDSGGLAEQGEVLARLEGALPGRSGRSVAGREAPPPAPRARPSAGPQVEHLEAEGLLRARVPGYARYEGLVVALEPLVQLSSDGLDASALVRPGTPGPPPSRARFERLAEGAGLRFGLLADAHERFLAAWTGGPRAEDWVPVARGQPPLAGADAQVRWLVDASPTAGLEREDGKIDYHQQRKLHAVSAGQVLAEKTPASPGSPGTTVTGLPIPATPGKDCRLEAGENIRLSEDGLRLLAAMDGVFTVAKGQPRVTDRLDVPGDVDFSTGDLECPSSLEIAGTVRSTFTVRTGGDLCVRDSVEDAIVEAQGAIHVGGGIIHRAVGSMAAGGRIDARHAQNAEIHSGEAILLRDSALHCVLVARVTVTVAEGRGVVIGGHLVAGERVVVRVAGSAMGVPTVLQAGVDWEALEPVERRLRAVGQQMARLLAWGGESFLEIASRSEVVPDEPRLAERLEEWRHLERERTALRQERAQRLQAPQSTAGRRPQVEVHEKLHPGVRIVIGGTLLQITEPAPGGRYVLNPETPLVEPVGHG